MNITITTAPCCWGVDDIANPNLPAWETVLAQAAAAGFGGLELGPYGYMPLKQGLVSGALREHDLQIIAGTIFDDLVSVDNRPRLLKQTAEICAFITSLPKPHDAPGQRFPAPYLTVMDFGHEVRDYAAGHFDHAPRLSYEDWGQMVETIKAIATLAQNSYGVRVVVHPHAGGFIEFSDEIKRIAEDIPADLAGLCLDTGHLTYAGIDPVQALYDYASRIDYLHFKDINPIVFREVIGKRIRFFDACAAGVMCPIGQGSIDYPAVRQALQAIGYAGFITVEQERDPRNGASVLHDLRQSRDYLKSIGF